MYPSFTSTNLQPFQLPFRHYVTLDDGAIFNQLLQQERMLSDDHSNHNANNTVAYQQFAIHDISTNLQSAGVKCSNNNVDDGFNKPKGISKRRRASKSDQHNKINTAQGPRDRRMRLSLEVSKKFFELHDMLGFDKPSKTIEWLLMKSNSNIQQLIISHGKSSFSGEFSTSKCDILSEDNIDGYQNAKSSSSINKKEKKTTIRAVKKRSYLLRAKETREMARKRARERTLRKSGKLACVSDIGDDQFSRFRPRLDQTTERDTICLMNTIINQPEQPRSHFHLKQSGIMDDNSSSMIGSWNPSFLSNYQKTVVHPDREHQFYDFQILGMRSHEFGQ